jgi:hypothetical protein
MKRIMVVLICLLLPLILKAQSSDPVDDLFNKYSGKEGFTSVYISTKMFSMFENKDSDDEDLNNLMKKLKSIRILTVSDSLLNPEINFYTELSRRTNFKSFESLMDVNEGEEVTKFLIKERDNKISELLVITGGQHGNTVISIRGDLDLKDISGLSRTMGIEQLKELENIDQNKK